MFSVSFNIIMDYLLYMLCFEFNPWGSNIVVIYIIMIASYLATLTFMCETKSILLHL